MATLSGRALSKQRDKNRRAKLNPNGLKTATSSPFTSATSYPTLNAAQIGGASGVGFEDTATQEVISSETDKAIQGGAPKSAAGEFSEGKYKGAATLNPSQATNYLKSFGLTGILDESELVGLTPEKANAKALQIKKQKQDQLSAGTSAVFNPEVTARTKRAIDRFGFALDEITNTPFNGKQSKINKSKALVESTSKELAKLFKSPEEFQNAYNSDAGFKASIDAFMKRGGDTSSVTSQITGPTQAPTEGTQDTASYLSDLRNPLANQEAEQKAIDELVPERELAQAEIVRQAGIAEDLKAFYLGDENTVGLVEQQKIEAEEEKRIIEQEEKDDKQNLRATAKHTISKNNAEVKIREATIEQNRLAAKNYMTGYLAKLGALNTTGAAGLGLQILEQKYQNQVNTLRTAAKYDNQLTELKLSEAINKVETDTDRSILKVQQDLTKTSEEVFKEISKAQQAADKEIYRITDSYATTLRTRTTKYAEDLKKEAEKYATAFAKTASSGIDLFSLSKTMDGSLKRSSAKNAIESSYATVKQDIKQNLPANVSTRIITELTDEEMSMFLEDYLSTRESSARSIDPVSFFETWKKTNGVNQTKAKSGSTEEEVYEPIN